MPPVTLYSSVCSSFVWSNLHALIRSSNINVQCSCMPRGDTTSACTCGMVLSDCVAGKREAIQVLSILDRQDTVYCFDTHLYLNIHKMISAVTFYETLL